MDYVYVHDFSPVSALVIGAPGSEWILLPKREAAFWEGHKKSTALFQKICWEAPEKKKPRSCRAQELSRSCAQWRGRKLRQLTKNQVLSVEEEIGLWRLQVVAAVERS